MQQKQKKRALFLRLSVIFMAMIAIILPLKLNAASDQDKVFVKIKYVRADNNYENWNVWTWSNTAEGKSIAFEKEDSEGRYVIIETTKDANLGFIIREGEGWDNKLTGDVMPDFSNGNVEYLATVAEDGTFTLDTREPKQAFDQVNLNIHYYRFDGNYDPWDVWLWIEDNNTMNNQAVFEGMDEFGAVSNNVLDPVAADKKIGFIVRKPDWSEKDWDGDRFIDKFFIDADGNVDLYIVSGQEEVYYDEATAMAVVENLNNPRITSAKIDSLSDIAFTTNIKMENITEKDIQIVNEETGEGLTVEQVTLAEDGLSGTIKVKEAIDLNTTYTVTITGFQGANLTMGKIFESEAFEQAYTYDGELGAVYSKEQTVFTLWTPTASNVQLALYGTDGSDYTCEAKEIIDMEKGPNGSWSATVPGDLNGTFYNYLVTNDGTVNEVVDPYAKALGVNGMRGMVVDLDATDPEGWEKDEKPVLEDPTDSIVYEMHIRDFSISENSGVTLEYRGKYNGVWEDGTTIPGTDVKTGVDHLKELGVTTVHLLPTFDHQSIDETKLDVPQFNWGYDPKNYNVPEGSYSSDPYTGTIRIEEFKQMVMELHKAGIRVVMDVVYNHTGATTDSNLNLAVPNYYYRQNAQGGFANGSGCGNETASERSMVGRLIVDSVAYWAEEYHIDGFRFDLMAIHDIDTMKEVRAAVDAIDPTILLYGEGWTGGDSPLPEDQKATKANTVKFGDLQIAAFSDDIRDGIKGSVFDAAAGGFINGGTDYEETIKFGVVASTPNDQIDYSKVKNQTQPWANQPYQTISYASAHDNLTLWDKLQSTNPNDSEEALIQLNKMSAAIVYTSQGIPFMQAGEEMARTKVNPDGSLNENSYNAPDSVNQIDWTRKVEYSDLYEYYKGLIQMRKAHKAFHMNTTEEIQNNLTFLNTNQKNVVAYTLNGKAVGDDWETIAVAFNANEEAVTITLPDSNWNVVVNEQKAGVETLAEVAGNQVTIPAKASYVLVKDNETQPEQKLQISYRTHVQNEGWQDFVANGVMSGTKGKDLRLEAIEIRLDNNTIGGSVEYRTHVQNDGWQDYVADGAMSGTTSRNLRLEAIQIRLTGAIAENYDIYYRTHIQDKGWLGWAVNDGKSGSAGLSKRLEAIEIRLVEKGGEAPGSTENAYLTNKKPANPTISYRTHVQNEGWQDYVAGGVTSGTTGKNLRLEAIEIQVNGDGLNGNVEYRTHVQNDGWQDYVANGAMAGTKGRSLRLEAIQIRLTGELAQKYSVEYRTHVQNEGWQNWVRDDAMSGTTGKNLRLEAIEIRLVKR